MDDPADLKHPLIHLRLKLLGVLTGAPTTRRKILLAIPFTTPSIYLRGQLLSLYPAISAVFEIG